MRIDITSVLVINTYCQIYADSWPVDAICLISALSGLWRCGWVRRGAGQGGVRGGLRLGVRLKRSTPLRLGQAVQTDVDTIGGRGASVKWYADQIKALQFTHKNGTCYCARATRC